MMPPIGPPDAGEEADSFPQLEIKRGAAHASAAAGSFTRPQSATKRAGPVRWAITLVVLVVSLGCVYFSIQQQLSGRPPAIPFISDQWYDQGQGLGHYRGLADRQADSSFDPLVALFHATAADTSPAGVSAYMQIRSERSRRFDYALRRDLPQRDSPEWREFQLGFEEGYAAAYNNR